MAKYRPDDEIEARQPASHRTKPFAFKVLALGRTLAPKADMANTSDLHTGDETPRAVSRRRFIRSVIGGGAAISSAGYLMHNVTVHGASPGERLITLNVNGQQRRVDVMKQET